MNRGDRARVAPGKGDQILVRLLGLAEPFAQVRHRAFFEGNDRRHRPREYARNG